MNLHRRTLPCVLAAGFGLLSVSVAAAPPVAPSEQESSTNWQTDARLQEKASINATGLALTDVLSTLGKGKVVLSCDSTCAAQKVQIHLKQRSLADIMAALTEFLPGIWRERTDHKGYFLQMSVKALRDRDNWWQLFEDEKRRVRKLAADNLLSAMRLSPQKPIPGEPHIEGSPDPATTQQFFNSLPATMQERIANSIDDNWWDKSGGQGMNAYDEEGALLYRVSALPEAARKILSGQNSILSFNAVVRFTNDGHSIQANVVSPSGKQEVSTMDIMASGPPIMAGRELNQSELLDVIKEKMIKDIPDNWKRLAAYQEKTFWKNDLVYSPAHSNVVPRRAEVLNWLADKGSMEFIADYYSQPSEPFPADTTPLSRPVEEELNARAPDYDISWKKQQSFYLIRNNRWYRDDLLEVPPTLARELLALDGDSAHPKTVQEYMDWNARFVTNLTRYQINNGLAWLARETVAGLSSSAAQLKPDESKVTHLFPFYFVAQHIPREFPLTQFYISLKPGQRALLCLGLLPFSSLTEEQRAKVLYLSPAITMVLAAGGTRETVLSVKETGSVNPKMALAFAAAP